MAEDNQSDHEIAIGRDAFCAGWYARADTIGGDSVTQSEAESLLEEAWSAYTPPEKLCGGGTVGDLNGNMAQPYDHTKRGFTPK